MSRKMLSLGVAIILFSAPAAGDGAIGLARARELVELLETLRLTRVTRERQNRDRIDGLKHQIERLLVEVRRAEEEGTAEERMLEETLRRVETTEAEARAVQASMEEVRRVLLEVVDRASGRVRAGLLHRVQERGQAIDGVREKAWAQDLATLVRAFVAYHSFLVEEIHRSREIELRHEMVSAGAGRGEHAQVLRLGLVEELWLTEDGGAAGVVGKGGATADLDEAGIESLRALLEMRRGQSPPRLVPVPFLLRGSERP